MTREEFKAKLIDAADADKAATALADIGDAVSAMFDDIDASAAKTAELEAQVAQLRDDNHRLFLRVADAPNETAEEDKELSPEEELDKLTRMLIGG